MTHQLFRYPAKFHPPVVRALVEKYTNPGDRVLDPFCGSGTSLVEAAAAGRRAVGLDVDPVAVLVSQAKTARYDVRDVERTVARLLTRLEKYHRGREEYERLIFADLSDRAYEQGRRGIERWIPRIPNLDHWFRRYVVIDLAFIRREINAIRTTDATQTFLDVVFASIIRNASNADPVPVSGLEVTAYMRDRDRQGRLVDPFSLLSNAFSRAVPAARDWRRALGKTVAPRVIHDDATAISSSIRGGFDAVITSPPYHNAVDYYRRHQLEMYWLGLTATHDDRLALLPKYIGRPRVARSHDLHAQDSDFGPLASKWKQAIAAVDSQRARDFQHYIGAMRLSFGHLGRLTRPGGRAVVVVGQSSWNGDKIPTDELFAELSAPDFSVAELLWYPVRNRYMSYTRRNGADINREYALVLERRRG